MLSGKRKRSWSTPPGSQQSQKKRKLSTLKKMARNPYRKYSTYTVPRASLSQRNDIVQPVARPIRNIYTGVNYMNGYRNRALPGRLNVSGGCRTLESNVGTQGTFYESLLDKTTLNNIVSADGNTNSANTHCKMLSGKLRMEITNQCNNQVILTLYHVQARMPSSTPPDVTYNSGLVDMVGLGSINGNNTFIDPETLGRFNNMWRITKKEEVALGAGAMTVIEHNRYYNRAYSKSVNDTITSEHYGPWCSGVFMLWHGGPVRATTTTPTADNAAIGPTLISFTVSRQIEYQVDEINDTRAYAAQRNYQAGTVPRLVTEDGDIPTAYATA